MNDKTSPKKFEEAFEALEKTVEALESGEIPLDESVALFQKGMTLYNLCMKKLEDTELRMQQLIKDSEGELHLEPFQE